MMCHINYSHEYYLFVFLRKKKKGETGGKNNLFKPLGNDMYYDVRRKNNYSSSWQPVFWLKL